MKPRAAADAAPGLRLVGGRKTPAPPPSTKPTAAQPLDAAAALARAGTLAGQSHAPATNAAYASDWAHFAMWCDQSDVAALPALPETVALYLAAHAEVLRPATLSRRLVSISRIHQEAKYETPTRATVVRNVFSGICREMGTAQTQKAPLLTDDVRTIVALLPDSLLGKRDKALFLLGFSGAFRRSELVGLNVADVTPCADGLIVTIRKSKTDQIGQGQRIGVPHGATPATCPVRAIRAWLSAAGIKTGAIFRPIDRHGNVAGGRLTGRGAAYVIKRAVAVAGLDPAQYAGHSLRAGLTTSAAQNGASERKIMEQTRHTSVKMVRRYIRNAEIFQDNAAASAGL